MPGLPSRLKMGVNEMQRLSSRNHERCSRSIGLQNVRRGYIFTGQWFFLMPAVSPRTGVDVHWTIRLQLLRDGHIFGIARIQRVHVVRDWIFQSRQWLEQLSAVRGEL